MIDTIKHTDKLLKIKKKIFSKSQLAIYSFGLISFIISACAQITAPTGGKKDINPPSITHSTPPNFSTNFHQKEITIYFNEWIQPLTNTKAQVIISPNIQPFPKIDIARNILSIKFKDTLQANTTYSIYFGDNIKDNNEGNALTNFKFLCSTGSFIDSLKVKGSLQTTLDKIPDNTYLLLYKEKEDTAFTKKRPFYVSKVNSDGSFSLENIKNGAYRIYALSDKNGNYYYDLPTEAIAFTDSMTTINNNIDSLQLELFLPEDSVLRIYDFDKIVKGGILHLSFNKELSFNKDEITVTIPGNKSIIPIAIQDKTPKNMTVYLSKLSTDTNTLTLVIKNNNKLIDTLHVRTESKHFKQPVYFFNDTLAYKSLNILENKPLKLIASYYSLEKPDSIKMEITDTANTKIPFTISREEDMQTYLFTAAWKPGMKYRLSILDSALVDLAGNYNKKQQFSFLVSSIKKAGNLLITYELPQKNHNYIAILKDNTGKVLDKQILRDSQRVKINYGFLFAGTYNIEVIDDTNNNGIWNSGSFVYKTLPEKIYKESNPIIIKENWDADETVKVDFTKKTNLSTTSPSIKNNSSPILNSPSFNNPQTKGIFGQ